jgi:hypothetical protein
VQVHSLFCALRAAYCRLHIVYCMMLTVRYVNKGTVHCGLHVVHRTLNTIHNVFALHTVNVDSRCGSVPRSEKVSSRPAGLVLTRCVLTEWPAGGQLILGLGFGGGGITSYATCVQVCPRPADGVRSTCDSHACQVHGLYTKVGPVSYRAKSNVRLLMYQSIVTPSK